MKISYEFKLNSNDKHQFGLSPSSLLKELPNTKQWPWFWVDRTSPVVYMQDYVHVAVKLKARLLKPSIILPMGDFLAGSHHLKMVLTNFTKDQHGIRHRDLEHKDKQNFEAVSRITAQCVLDLLQQIPDAKGTFHYLKCLQFFVDTYLNKTLSPLERIYKAWYVVFFYRFWHGWLLEDKKHTIRNNFITYNAHACIELNGHSLILFLLTLRDKIPNGDQHFLPWLLGSQACEQTFRAARSMTSTFSTVINFSMLGFLHRLHRLQIQLQLESEAHETGISYPRATAHLKKVGYNSIEDSARVISKISDMDIISAIERAYNEAVGAMNDLGISFSKEEIRNILSKPVKVGQTDEIDDDNDDEDYDIGISAGDTQCTAKLEAVQLENKDFGSDIAAMKQFNMIKKGDSGKIKEKFKCIEKSTIPMYAKFENNQLKQQTKTVTPFVEVTQKKDFLYPQDNGSMVVSRV